MDFSSFNNIVNKERRNCYIFLDVYTKFVYSEHTEIPEDDPKWNRYFGK